MTSSQLAFDFTPATPTSPNGHSNGQHHQPGQSGAWSRRLSKPKDPLTQEEEQPLIEKAQAGCIQSRNRLIEHNMGIIYQLAFEYNRCYENIEVDEFLSVGVEGMITAVPCFDPSTGCKFYSYAIHYVKQRMRQLADTDRLIRLPGNASEELRKLHKGEIESNQRLESFQALQPVESFGNYIQ